jgi:hypothetical protein
LKSRSEPTVCQEILRAEVLSRKCRAGRGNGNRCSATTEYVSALRTALAHGGVGQTVGLRVVLTRDVRDRKAEGAGQFAACPMEGVEARTAANVLPTHLPDHDFRVRIDVKFRCVQGQGALQRFHESGVLSDVIVLVADPFCDSDLAALASVDHDPNTGWPRISQRAAIYVGHKI